MKKIAVGLIAGVFALMMNGCAQKQLYYFGSYSNTLYSCEKNQTEEALLKHKQELEKIISESEKRQTAVPPGVYAELGFIHLKNNNTEKAVGFFQIEAETFPESRHLMERLIQMADKKTSG